MDWFGTADYARLYGHRDGEEARAWVEALIAGWRLPDGSEVLDMACGRGRHAAWFAKAGMRVTGIDISDASLAKARERVPEARFVLHDIRQPFAHERFDACCCLFTSMGYFDDTADDPKVFAAAYTALKPGGCFTLDFMNTPKVLAYLIPETILEKDGVTFTIGRDLVDGVLVKRILARDHQGERRYEERVRALAPEVLELMAAEVGFTILDRTDGPIMRPYVAEDSDRYVLWCRKPR